MTTPKLTTVINIREAPPGWLKDPRYVYIGRQMRHPTALRRSPFANPHKFIETGHELLDAVQRQIVFGRFCRDLLLDEELLERVRRELPGKTLVCWCKPLLCHGDILAEIANGVAKGAVPRELPGQMKLFG